MSTNKPIKIYGRTPKWVLEYRVHDGEVLRNPRDRFNPTIRVRSL